MARLAAVLTATLFIALGCASDERLTREVTSELEASAVVEGGQISISVDRGVVTLDGTVRSIEELDRVIAIVQDVSGVRGFTSNLEIVGKSAGER